MFNKSRVVRKVRSVLTKKLVSVNIGRFGAGSVYQDDFNPEMLKRAVSIFWRQYPALGGHLSQAIDKGHADVPEDEVDQVAEEMRQFYHQETDLFRETEESYPHSPTRSTWFKIADRFESTADSYSMEYTL